MIIMFDVDNVIVELEMESPPKREQYAEIFPDARCVVMKGFRCAQDAGERVAPPRWPIYSDAAGCAPSQIARMKQLIPELDHTPDGRAIFKSPLHRRRCLKKLGMFDRNGYD